MATAVGVSHIRSDLPCQDVAEYKALTDARGGEVLAFVVSDGAGSASRAEAGAAIAAATLLKKIEIFLAEGGDLSQVAVPLAESWIENVQAEIGAAATAEELTPRDFACTLLAAVVGNDASVFLQIGDGAIVIADDEEDDWGWVFWPQHGEFANTTNFVTEDHFRETLQVLVEQKTVREVALFTDGIERLVLHHSTKTVYAPFFKRMFSVLREGELPGFDAKRSESLASFLNSEAVCARTDDDKSLILATRRAAPDATTVQS